MSPPIRAALLAALTLPALALLPAPAPPCRLQVIPDYTLLVAYRAVLRPSSGCPAGAVLRVRKSSTLNVRREGAPYQPIRPGTGAWEVAGPAVFVNRPVPGGDLWTLLSWRWEYFDPEVFNTRTNTPGRWIAAEVLHAVP